MSNFIRTTVVFLIAAGMLSFGFSSQALAENFSGTWVSQQWSHQKHTFYKDQLIVFDEGSGKKNTGSKGKYEVNGNMVSWKVKWKTGGYTIWKGVEEGNSMKVQFYNSWDGYKGNDTLLKQ